MKKKAESKKKNASAAALGSLGGKAIAKKIGKGGMRELGKIGASARWGGRKVAA